jgi:type I restriction enzyme M protein
MADARNGGGDLNFEVDLFRAADKLRGNLEPSEYKHVVLGLIFLKYISDAFELQRAKLLTEEFADPEDPEEYLAARVFWVPDIARWSNLKANPARETWRSSIRRRARREKLTSAG